MDAKNAGVDNGGGVNADINAPPSKRKGYCSQNPPKINYGDKRANGRSIGWINLIVGDQALHNVTIYYVNIVIAIATFF